MSKQIQYEDGEWSREIDTREEPPMTTSDPTPGNHDALLNETDIRLATGFNPGGRQVYVADDERRMRKLAAALRTEQRARQEAEGRIENALACYVPKPELGIGRSRWRDADEFLVAIRAALTVPTESKEPDHE